MRQGPWAGWHSVQILLKLLQSRITLLYKGKRAESSASYRPITLLNIDSKLAARAKVTRICQMLDHFVDATQIGFFPKLWTGDTLLAHLEEISYLKATQQPGVLVFLEFVQDLRPSR